MRRSDNIVPELCVHDGRGALEFYKQAFGAIEQEHMMSPDGTKLLHGALTIDGHRLVVFDEFSTNEGGTCRCPKTLGGTGVRLILEVEDAEAVVRQAVAAGATIMMPVSKMFWGARYGKLKDPYGHEWGINEQLEELSPAAEARAAERYFQKP
ncbi:MAG: VOC family protein [Gemmatimonadaceae bacterium]